MPLNVIGNRWTLFLLHLASIAGCAGTVFSRLTVHGNIAPVPPPAVGAAPRQASP